MPFLSVSSYRLSFSISDCAVSLGVGFVVSLYQLTSSPHLYQAYFPIPTLYQLRLTLAFYGVFQLFSSILIFLIVSLFLSYMDISCSNMPFSYQSFFRFINQTVAQPVLTYVVMVSLLSTFAFSIQWLYMSITTHIWEEFMKAHLREIESMRQLCWLQSALMVICAISVSLVSLIRLLHLPYDAFTPIVIFFILTLSAVICGVFVCGYFLSFCNSKGALTSLFVSLISSICMLYLFTSHNHLSELRNDCATDMGKNITVQLRSFNMEKMVLMASYLPVQSHPIVAFVITVFVCPVVSFFTGGQDQMSLDWNLVVIPCSESLTSQSTFHKRPFIESESFRYAQHTAGPGLLRYQR
ncbi:hypothetical protein KIN20_009793 [Parelaphostrongylus tenuis]|uniref:Uncharacterized protein n=1 Tax=Parelaphostrongylus tenuis TaxID=148309 RepID=A0AAD5M6W4_PARTN|nr:hypothetical protein KIN20_009793 [Parelaphostrongylus tenuis]